MLDAAQTPESPIDHYCHSSAQGFTFFHAVGRSKFISTASSSEGQSSHAKFSTQPWQMQKPGVWYSWAATCLWDVSTTDLPSLITLRAQFHKKRRALGSIPVVGSSCKIHTKTKLHSTNKYLISEITCPFWLCVLEKLKISKFDSFSKTRKKFMLQILN